MLQAITQKEFEERFPDIYILDVNQVAYYLENGVVLLESEYDGEEYFADGKCYKPAWNEIDTDEFELVGFEESF